MVNKIIKIVVILLTIVISATTIAFVAIPHHAVTEKKAIDLACDYYIYRMGDIDLQIKNIKVSKTYKKVESDVVKLIFDSSTEYNKNILSKFIDYWNPNLILYDITIITDIIDTPISIYVDSYSGYIQDGSEGVRWKFPRKEGYIESMNEEGD